MSKISDTINKLEKWNFPDWSDAHFGLAVKHGVWLAFDLIGVAILLGVITVSLIIVSNVMPIYLHTNPTVDETLKMSIILIVVFAIEFALLMLYGMDLPKDIKRLNLAKFLDWHIKKGHITKAKAIALESSVVSDWPQIDATKFKDLIRD